MSRLSFKDAPIDNAIISMSLHICKAFLYRSNYPYSLQVKLEKRIDRLIKKYDNRSEAQENT
jgi:hypothetical protein